MLKNETSDNNLDERAKRGYEGIIQHQEEAIKDDKKKVEDMKKACEKLQILSNESDVQLSNVVHDVTIQMNCDASIFEESSKKIIETHEKMVKNAKAKETQLLKLTS